MTTPKSGHLREVGSLTIDNRLHKLKVLAPHLSVERQICDLQPTQSFYVILVSHEVPDLAQSTTTQP